ncbi:MAG: hypothetical protein KY468_04750 [Armatimonadetes bacterium]|nr:hypothetical protein [Armatimonadota bacterium]
MPVYTDFPLVADIRKNLVALGVSLDRLGIAADQDAYLERKRQEVTREIERFTRRQFVADTIDATRRFDGSGTAELDVDEMVSLTKVELIGPAHAPYYTFTNIELKYPGPGRPQNTLVLRIPGVSPNARYGVFPEGRQNIEVTGKFGYAAAVPADLWEAVAGEVAERCARERFFEIEGRTEEIKADQFSKRVSFGRGVEDDLEKVGYSTRYRELLRHYKRPERRRSRRYISTMA